MKRISASLWLLLNGLVPVVLYADVLPGSSDSVPAHPPMQDSSHDEALSWPRGGLLVGNVRWLNGTKTAKKCLVVSRDDPNNLNHPNTSSAIDLPGEQFVAVLTIASGFGPSGWHFDEALKSAGYSDQLFIPEKHVVLSGQMPEPHEPGIAKGYLKREGNDIRLILISYCEGFGDQTASMGPASTCLSMGVFVSKIFPLDQILKNKT